MRKISYLLTCWRNMSGYCTVKSMTGGQHEERPKTLYICRTVLYMRRQLLKISAWGKSYQLVSIVTRKSLQWSQRLQLRLGTGRKTSFALLAYNAVQSIIRRQQSYAIEADFVWKGCDRIASAKRCRDNNRWAVKPQTQRYMQTLVLSSCLLLSWSDWLLLTELPYHTERLRFSPPR